MVVVAARIASSIAEKVAGPSRSRRTWLPLETSAAAMRQSPRANDGPAAGGGTGSGASSSRTVRLWAITCSSSNSECMPGRLPPAAIAEGHGNPKYILRMLNIDLSGRRAFVAGVADDAGFG